MFYKEKLLNEHEAFKNRHSSRQFCLTSISGIEIEAQVGDCTPPGFYILLIITEKPLEDKNRGGP